MSAKGTGSLWNGAQKRSHRDRVFAAADGAATVRKRLQRVPRTFLRCAPIFFIALAGAAVLCAQSAEPQSATLYTEFQQPAATAVMDSMRDEAQSIMGRLGINLEWRSLAAATGTEVSAQLAVMRFQGKCEVSGLVARRVNPGALGWTHESDGVILPFGAVDCDRIRSFLQLELLGAAPDQRELIYGRALGRVLAHELYHIFTRSAHHSASGVGKASYAVRDLLGGRFVFDSAESSELRGAQTRGDAADVTR